MRRARRLSLEELAPFLLPLPELPTVLNGPVLFGNDRPLEVEVGFGKGLFLLTAAQANPSVNYLGVEILRKYQLFTATRLAKRGLRNVRVAQADARLFFRDYLADASVQGIHVYFPDPWWKQRHRKRRLFTPEFAGQCERVLNPGSRLRVVTDVEDHYNKINALLGERTRLRPLPAPAPNEPQHDLDFLTNFERKFRKESRPIYRAVFEKPRAPEAEDVAPLGVPGPVSA
jgi:tRNA (guanine-N7-)-methyltransferase